MTAAGPFTIREDMEYAPFRDLLEKVIIKKPDVLILLGPFVDISQPIVASGDLVLIETISDENNENTREVSRMTASYEMAFIQNIITNGLNSLFNSEAEYGYLPTNIILIPSLLDAHHEFVFPQPPFGDRDEVKASFLEESLGVLQLPYSKENDKRKRVHVMPNPCMFR